VEYSIHKPITLLPQTLYPQTITTNKKLNFQNLLTKFLKSLEIQNNNNNLNSPKFQYFNMDNFLQDCENFQTRAAAFKIKRENALKELILPSDAKYRKPINYVPPPTKSKRSFKKRIKKLLTGCT
jgi:hypothetical protein